MSNASLKQKLISHIEKNGNPVNARTDDPIQNAFQYHVTDPNDLTNPEKNGGREIIPDRHEQGSYYVVDDGDTYYKYDKLGNRTEIRNGLIDSDEIGQKSIDSNGNVIIQKEPDPVSASQGKILRDTLKWASDNGYEIQPGQLLTTDKYGRQVLTTIIRDPKTGDAVNFESTSVERGWSAKSSNVIPTKKPNANQDTSIYTTTMDDALAEQQGLGVYDPKIKAIKDRTAALEKKEKKPLYANSKLYTNPKVDFDDPINDNMFKIGDVWLEIPPTHVSINQLRSSYNIPLLGFESKPINGSLTNRIIIKANVFFESEESINQDLKRILVQFRYSPINIIKSKDVFMKVAGEATWLNTAYGLRGDYCVPVTMDSYTLYTVESHPGCIGCSLQFSVFNFAAYFHADPNERLEYFKFTPEKFNIENGEFKLVSNQPQIDIWETTTDLEESIHPYNFVIEGKILDSFKFDGAKFDSNFSMAKVDTSLTEKESTTDAGKTNVITDEQIEIFANSMITDVAHSISVQYENNFAWQPMVGYAQPVCQYIGPGDTQISINIKTNDQSNIQKYLKTYSENISPNKYGFYDDRYFLDASLTNVADVKIASVQNVSVHNMENKPGWFDINLMFNKSSYESIIRRDEAPEANDEYWGIQKLFKCFKIKSIEKKMDAIESIVESASSKEPIYRIQNPNNKDVNGLNVAFRSDINYALKFIEEKWSAIAPGSQKETIINPDAKKNNKKIEANNPVSRMKVVQAKLQPSDLKNEYEWKALEARSEILNKYQDAVVDLSVDTKGAKFIKSAVYYEALTKNAKSDVNAIISDGTKAAAFDGRLIVFDVAKCNKKEANAICSVFSKSGGFEGVDGFNDLTKFKAKWTPMGDGSARIYVTNEFGNQYKNTGELPHAQALVFKQLSEKEKKELVAEMNVVMADNRPLAAHRYMEGIDDFITTNAIGSRTVGYWFACDKIKNINNHISTIVDAISHTRDIVQEEDAFKTVYFKDTASGMDKDVAGLIDEGNPYTKLRALVYPTLRKDTALYNPKTMLINNRSILSKDPATPEVTDYHFDTWSDNVLNNDYLGSGADLKRYTDNFAQNVAARVEYNIPAGTAGYYEYLNDSTNVGIGNVKAGTNTLVKRSTYSGVDLSDGIVGDITKVSTPIQKANGALLLNQKMLSMAKNIEYTSYDDGTKPEQPKSVKPKQTAPVMQEPQAISSHASGNVDPMLQKWNKAKLDHPEMFTNGKNVSISTTSDYKYYTKNGDKKVANELKKEVTVAVNNNGVFDATMLPSANPRGTAIDQRSVDEQIANFMWSQLPTFGVQNAFPTFKMYIIVDHTSEYKYKLLDNYYDYRLVQDLMVIRDKNNPSHLLKARVLVDPRYTTTSGRVNQTLGSMRTGTGDGISTTNIDYAKMDTARGDIFSMGRSPLRQGMRICIKLGYHTDPRALDTVFIGTITGLQGTQDQGIYTVEARGDGRELLVPASIQDYSMHGDNFADLINIMLRSNPNIRHFGKVYGSFLERFSRDHREIMKFLSQNIASVPLFGATAGATAVTAPMYISPAIVAAGTVIGLSGAWLTAATIGSAAVIGAAAGATAFAVSGDMSSARLVIDKAWYNWDKYDLGGRFSTWFDDVKSRLKGQVFDANKAGYQLTRHMKNVYEYGNNPIDDNIFAVDIFSQGQGKNVNLKVNNQKSVWDVLTNIKRMYPGWALDVRPYGNRSTLYLGPIGFNYWRTDDPLIAMAPSLIDMDKQNAIGNNAQYISELNGGIKKIIKRDKFGNRDISESSVGTAPFVPFVRHHTVSSHEDIIFNGIRCTPERGWNSVVVAKAGDAEPEEYVANEAVFKSSIRRKFEIVDWTSDDRLRKQYAIGLLKEGVEKLYGGTLIIRGNPKIEPYDRIQIMDNVNRMYGTIEVETVIHKYDSEMGFTTHIVPNMVCSINDSSYLTMGDITKRIVVDKLRNMPLSEMLYTAGTVAAGAFLPFWPMLAVMGTVEVGRMVYDNIKELNSISTVSDTNKRETELPSDIGWAIKAREISVRSNIEMAGLTTGAVLKAIYKLNKERGTVDWKGITEAAKARAPKLSKTKDGMMAALNTAKENAKAWKEYATAKDYLRAIGKLPGRALAKVTGKGISKAAATEAEAAAVKSLGNTIMRFGGPMLKTAGGIATFLAFEGLPTIFETYAFKAATKNQVISVKPLWYKDSLMMQGLEGYKNTDVWMHMRDVIINAGDVAGDMFKAVKSFNLPEVEDTFDKIDNNFGVVYADDTTSISVGALTVKGKGAPDNGKQEAASSVSNILELTKSKNFLSVQPYVKEAHDKYPNVPIAMINAVIYAESRFNAGARDNYDGRGGRDRGIMQINSRAHPDCSDATAYNPRTAIMYGTKMLSDTLKSNGGNMVNALHAYNGFGKSVNAYAVPVYSTMQQFTKYQGA